jgi:hypothetical protein
MIKHYLIIITKTEPSGGTPAEVTVQAVTGSTGVVSMTHTFSNLSGNSTYSIHVKPVIAVDGADEIKADCPVQTIATETVVCATPEITDVSMV